MRYKTLRFLFSFHGTVYKYGDTIEVEDAKDLEIPIREGCVERIEDMLLLETQKTEKPKMQVNRKGGAKLNGRNNKL